MQAVVITTFCSKKAKQSCYTTMAATKERSSYVYVLLMEAVDNTMGIGLCVFFLL